MLKRILASFRSCSLPCPPIARRSLGTTGLLVTSACTAEPNPLLVIDTPPGLTVCGGQTEYLEEFVGQVFEFFEEDIPPNVTFELHQLDIRTLRETECPHFPNALGCATQRVAWSTADRVDRHELVHLATYEFTGRATAALSEGIAHTLGEGLMMQHMLGGTIIPIENFLGLTSRELEGDQGVNAALFTTYLLDRFGRQNYIDLYSRLPAGSSLAHIKTAFSDILGESLESISADYQALTGNRCVFDFLGCVDPDLPFLEPPFVIDETFDCSSELTLGYLDERPLPKLELRRPVRHYQVELPEDGEYDIFFNGGEGKMVLCQPVCDTDPFPYHVNLFDSPFTNKMALPAGHYAVRIEARTPSLDVKFSVAPTP